MTPAILKIAPEGNLTRYLQRIREFPMLSAEEELALARRWRDSQDIEAAHKLVTSHLRLVAKIAMGYRGYGLPVGELISEGNVGMMQAVRGYDLERWVPPRHVRDVVDASDRFPAAYRHASCSVA
jgi:RNA polymerase sigma-32 factor